MKTIFIVAALVSSAIFAIEANPILEKSVNFCTGKANGAYEDEITKGIFRICQNNEIQTMYCPNGKLKESTLEELQKNCILIPEKTPMELSSDKIYIPENENLDKMPEINQNPVNENTNEKDESAESIINHNPEKNIPDINAGNLIPFIEYAIEEVDFEKIELKNTDCQGCDSIISLFQQFNIIVAISNDAHNNQQNIVQNLNYYAKSNSE